MSYSTILFFSSALMVLFLIMGVLIGWTVNEFAFNYLAKNNNFQTHPEMYDDEGIWINEELLSVRFVEDEEEYEEEEED